jgi:hypothetical protein
MIRRLRFLPLVGAALALAACAGDGSGIEAAGALRSSAPRPTACDAEMGAFVAVSQLAKRYGDNWTLFEAAIGAMRDQILDCVEDSYPVNVGI